METTIDSTNDFDDVDEHQKRAELVAARKNASKKQQPTAKDLAKDVAKLATPVGGLSLVFSLIKEMNFFGDAPMVVALLFAILKDLLDAFVVGEIPIIGTVLAFMCSVLITMMTYLVASKEQSAAARKMMPKILVILGGAVIAIIPGINLIPEETLTVIVVYLMVLYGRKYS